jgi:hypothetical protein
LSREYLVQIQAPHFCAGLVILGARCVDAAPILKWAKGKHVNELASYFRKRGWKTEGMPVEILTTNVPPSP